MRVLALDTTTRAGSVALVDDDRVVVERAGDPSRTHAERLPADLLTLTNACHLVLGDVDVFAVASGPGSFTGLRVGIATMQGLALVRRRPVVGIPALDAMAYLAAPAVHTGEVVAAWMDAHRGEVFSRAYRLREAPGTDERRLEPLGEPRVGTPEATMERWREERIDEPVLWVGDGAVYYAESIRREVGTASIVPAPALAGAVGRLAAARVRAGDAPGPAAIRPLYVRRPDAELARDARR
jgi:tRNA threonylcarbamoyladenosine biosynthesis protein TsaB